MDRVVHQGSIEVRVEKKVPSGFRLDFTNMSADFDS